MVKKRSKSSTKLFLVLSVIIALLDITFVGITFYQSRLSLIANFEKEAATQHATFGNSFKETTNNMLQIATFVANDPRVQQTFLKGKLAVEQEGGGSGKQLASHAREELLQIVGSSWAEMTKQFNARQLHFHLGPGSTSFLRVHKTHKFGDNMDNVRYTIVDANKNLQATTGFETGRVYSGIRGVQPVFAIDPKTLAKTHVGAVESGISYHDLLNNLSKTFNIDIVVLLHMEHIQSNVWPSLLAKRLKRNPQFGNYVIEEATSQDFKQILTQSVNKNAINFDNDKIKCISWDKRFFVTSEIPLRDYRGTIDPTLKDAGKIVFWQDVTAIHDALDKFYPLGVLTEQFIKDNTSAILKDIEDNFVSALSKQGMKEGKNYLSLQIAQKLTADFLALEMQLLKKAAADNKRVNIIGKEAKLTHSITVDGIDFNLLGKADRVDFEGDVLRIIDYKTGKVDQSEVAFAEYDEIADNPKKAKAFQLLMYAYLYLNKNPQYLKKKVVAGNFSFKNLKEGLICVSKYKANKETYTTKIKIPKVTIDFILLIKISTF